MTFDLNTSVGRRAVEAGHQGSVRVGSSISTVAIEAIIQAAVAVLTSDVCPTCEGEGKIEVAADHPLPCFDPCPDCDNGKVQPALPTWELFEPWMRQQRAWVIAEVTQDLAEQLEAAEASKGPDDPPDVEQGIEFAIDYIERRERER